MIQHFDQTDPDFGIDKIGSAADKKSHRIFRVFDLLLNFFELVPERLGGNGGEVTPFGKIFCHEMHGQMTNNSSGDRHPLFCG